MQIFPSVLLFLPRRRFVMGTFCSGDVLLQETFCYGDVLLLRRFVWRRFVEETFCAETFCMCAVLGTNSFSNFSILWGFCVQLIMNVRVFWSKSPGLEYSRAESMALHE
jgi:hypothetical protein